MHIGNHWPTDTKYIVKPLHIRVCCFSRIMSVCTASTSRISFTQTTPTQWCLGESRWPSPTSPGSSYDSSTPHTTTPATPGRRRRQQQLVVDKIMSLPTKFKGQKVTNDHTKKINQHHKILRNLIVMLFKILINLYFNINYRRCRIGWALKI